MYKDVSDAEMDRFAIFARECDNVDTGDMLADVRCPVLVLAASEDRVVLPVASDKIVDKLNAAGVPCEYKVFEGYGHAAFDEIKEYKDRILEFLKR